MEVNGQTHTSTAFLLRKELLVHIKWEIEWASEVVWTYWRIQKSFSPAGVVYTYNTQKLKRVVT
jgi:hypothetical protein